MVELYSQAYYVAKYMKLYSASNMVGQRPPEGFQFMVHPHLDYPQLDYPHLDLPQLDLDYPQLDYPYLDRAAEEKGQAGREKNPNVKAG